MKELRWPSDWRRQHLPAERKARAEGEQKTQSGMDRARRSE